MDTIKRVLLYCFLWFSSIYHSLPKFYYCISSKRGIPVREFRQLENLATKVGKKRLDVEYWNRCLDLGICPEFLTFKPPNVKQYRSTRDLYQHVVRKGLNIAKEELAEAEVLHKTAHEELTSKLSFMERYALIRLLNTQLKSTTTAARNTHNKKLLNLWMKSRPRSPDCLKNLSSKELTVEERNVLYRGLKHHILPKKLRGDEVKVNIEKLVNAVILDEARRVVAENPAQGSQSDKDVFKEAVKQVTHSLVTSAFRDEVKGVFRSFMSASKNVCSSRVNRSFHETISHLSNDKDLVVCQFDKGNGVCLMNSGEYIDKLDTIINDEDKFVEITPSKRKNARHPIIRRQEVLKELINEHVKKHITPEEYSILVPVGCGPGKLYGTCKIHKPNNPLRPVVSMIRTPEYELAKYLDRLIKPNIPDKFMLYSTDNFLEKLNKFDVRPGDKSISFDVVSLFTNVPLKETINIIADHLYSEKAKLTPPFDKKAFINMLEITTGGMFLHKDLLFRQTDGVSMGNPLAPTMANFFLAYLETKLFDDPKPFYPVFYSRYVDDIFCVFRREVDFMEFFALLNSLHPSLGFTYEESGSTLPFLDVEVQLSERGCETWVYRKCTNTNTLLHFDAVAPVRWKSGLVKCMVNRAQRLSSSAFHFQNEVAKLKSIFAQNAYPVQFFDKIYHRFIQNTHQNTATGTLENDFKYNLKVPFVGKPSLYFGKKMSALMKKQFGVEINVIPATVKLGSFFPLKCRTPLPVLSRVVYRFQCLGDQTESYVGMTVRTMSERVKEHLKGRGESAIHDHIASCHSCKQISLSNFSILKKCRTQFDTKIHI